MRNVIVFNLGQDGVERSSKESALYLTAQNCRGFLLVPLILGQRPLPCGRLTSLVGLVGQRFLPRGRLTSLGGLDSQRFLPRGCLTLLVGLIGQRFIRRHRSPFGHSAIPRHIALCYPGKELVG